MYRLKQGNVITATPAQILWPRDQTRLKRLPPITFCPESRSACDDNGCVFLRAREKGSLTSFDATQGRQSRGQSLPGSVRFDQSISRIQKHVTSFGSDFLRQNDKINLPEEVVVKFHSRHALMIV